MYNSTAERSPTGAMTALYILLSAVFGAADQFLGSWPGHGWAIDVSLLSSPWLVLPFLVGSTQRSARRAMTLAVICTSAALLGFSAMTLSPVEEAKVTLASLMGLLRGQIRWFVAGAVTSSLFGWLGHRWRTGKAVWPPIACAAAVCCEPFARLVVGQPIRSSTVRFTETSLGAAALVGYLIWQLFRGGLVRGRAR
jgi:hypothetical protein